MTSFGAGPAALINLAVLPALLGLGLALSTTVTELAFGALMATGPGADGQRARRLSGASKPVQLA